MRLRNHPVILTVCVHTVLVWLTAWEVHSVLQQEVLWDDPMLAWYVFVYLDFPASVMLFPEIADLLQKLGVKSDLLMASVGFTVLGGLQWGLIAWGCVRLLRWKRSRTKRQTENP